MTISAYSILNYMFISIQIFRLKDCIFIRVNFQQFAAMISHKKKETAELIQILDVNETSSCKASTEIFPPIQQPGLDKDTTL